MDNDQSDTIDDPGRKESEKRLKNKMGSKYLEEVMEKTGKDYEETVDAIDREKKAYDAMADGVADVYGADFGTDKVDWAARNTHTMPVRPKPATDDRQDFAKASEEDKQRVKDLLAAGKRVSKGETGRKKADKWSGVFVLEPTDGNASDFELGGAAKLHQLEKRMKKMQKGVKKMTEETEKQ